MEAQPSNLFWAMDNVMYSSEHVWDLRWRNGKFEPVPALSRGQWQVSQDDAGRIYRNVNDALAGRTSPEAAMKRAQADIERALATF